MWSYVGRTPIRQQERGLVAPDVNVSPPLAARQGRTASGQRAPDARAGGHPLANILD
jgi:hypothetical protein